MIRILLLLLALLLGAPTLSAQDDANPHLMLDKDGEPDLDKCGFCHDDDLSLLQAKEENCLTCHSATEHGGADEHLRAKGDAVAALLPKWKDDESLDFTDAGGVYCGTCHLFHDPNDASEPWLQDQAGKPATEFSAAMRRALETYRDSIAGPDAAHFGDKPTRALRLPAHNGALCVHCHSQQRTMPADKTAAGAQP
jgi:hypothetical protein